MAFRFLRRDKGSKTHDLTVSYPAVTRVEDGGKRIRLAGHNWGERMKAGDYVVLPNGKDTTRYRLTKIDYMLDPKQQWFADADFAPR